MSFMEMETRTGGYPDTLLIFVTSQVNTTLVLDNPRLTGSAATYNITAGKVNRIPVDPNYYYPIGSEFNSANLNSKRGLRIVAKDPVNVYCMNLEINRSDGTFVLPYESIPAAPEFFVASFPPNAGTSGSKYAQSEFVIIGMDNSVKVEITPTYRTAGGNAAGTAYTVTLSRGQVYQVQSNDADGTNNTDPAATSWSVTGAKNGDLTGTRIRVVEGCGKINVFSGARSIYVTKGNCGAGINGRDHLYTQVLPTNALGKDYILMPFSGQTGGYAYKVIAANDTTKVYINGTLSTTIMKKGEWIYQHVTSATPHCVRTDKPAYVVQYMKNGVCSGLTGSNGDPAILIMPDVNQRLLKTTVGTATTSNMNQHWVNILVDWSARSIVKLNGTSVSAASFTSFSCGGKSYGYAQIKVANPSSNVIECDSGMVVVAYGVGPYESYAYSAGALFENTSYDIKIARKTQCPGEPVKLTAIVEGKPKIRGYRWTFGDGTSDTGISVVHKFAKIGTYYVVVKMPVLLDCGVVDTIVRSKIISFKQGPVFDFPDTITQCTSTLNYVLSAPFSSKFLYKWQDSSTNRSFTAIKDQKLWLRVKDTSTNCVSIDSAFVRRSDALNARIAFDTLNRCYKTDRFVMKDGTKYNNDAFDRSVWKLTDWYKKKTTLIDTVKFSYTFDTIGSYSLRYMVYSKKGCGDTLDTALVVYPYPVAYLTTKKNYFCEKAEITIVDSSASKEGIGKSYWDFGNGDKDTIISSPYQVKYTFKSTGNFRVRLITESTVGCRDTVDSTYVVQPAPVNKANFTVVSPCFKNNQFEWQDATSLASGTWTVLWEYPIGKTSTASKVTAVSFTDTGYQNIYMTTTSNLGCMDRDTFKLYVAKEPKAYFTIKDSSICYSTNYFTFEEKCTVGTKRDPLGARRDWKFSDGTAGYANTVPNKTFPGSGTYWARVIAVSNLGCKDSFQRNVDVLPNPLADIFVNASDQCLKGNSFKVKMEKAWGGSGALKHSWWFGDGASATTDSATHSYAGLGKFRITHSVYSNKGCKDSTWIEVNVVETPNVSFTSSRDTACLGGGTFNFTNGSTYSGTYNSLWSFGDATTSTSKNVTGKSYTTAGAFNVKLYVLTPDGCIDSAEKLVNVYPVPKAYFVVNNISQCLQGNKFVISNGSNANGASGMTYDWFVKTTLVNSGITIPDQTMPDTGDYRLLLIAKSDKGCATQYYTDLRVNEHPRVSIVGSNACAKTPVNFKAVAAVNRGFIASYNWDFGNGANSSQQNPVYTYVNPGSYNVVLTATSDRGCTSTSVAYPVTVKTKPVADFTSKYLLSRGFDTDWQFDFTGQDADVYSWQFEDGQVMSGGGPIMATFSDTGNFKAYLRVVNNSGCSDSIEKYIFLKPELLRWQINAFTPNADGLNEEFAPDKNSFGVTKYRMRIINRWGEILYYTEDPKKGWDGTDTKGEPAQEGAYTYQISFRYIDGKLHHYEGILMLMRP